jgi:hypothetical protein
MGRCLIAFRSGASHPYDASMRARRLALLTSLSLLGVAAAFAVSRGADPRAGAFALPPAFAGNPRAATGPEVALLATAPGASHSSLYLSQPGSAAAALAPVATITHAEDAAVRGAVVPGTSVVAVVADTKSVRDLSFAASLFRVAPHRPPEVVCDRVVHASRPLVTREGRVFVSRGVAGQATLGSYRVDDLTIDEVDLATGTTRAIHTFSGYLAYLAGSFGREILVYRVDAAGADLVAVDPDTGAVRTITTLLPFARDFSVDEARGAIVLQERDEQDSRAWTIDRIDLASGARTRLVTSPSMSLAPFAWPGGGVVWSLDGRRGLSVLGGGPPLTAAPLGPGVDLVRAVSQGGAWVAALHTVPSMLPVPFAVDARTGAAAAIPAPPGVRVEIAGFMENGGAP